jgi:hypothetical protein
VQFGAVKERNLLPAPVFIVGPARSGTTWLFTLLSSARELWSAYRELHDIYEHDLGFHPNVREGESNELTARHATPEVTARLRGTLFRAVSNGELFGFPSQKAPMAALYSRRALRVVNRFARVPIRVVEKNPKHCFRLGFLHAVFPDARFVLLHRNARPNISSLIESWDSKRYVTYAMAGTSCSSSHWSFDLPPGWPSWAHEELPALCAHQWVGYARAVLDGAAMLPAEQVIHCYYEDLVRDPHAETRRLFAWLGVTPSQATDDLLLRRAAVNSLTPPSPDKWPARAQLLDQLEPIYGDTLREFGYRDGTVRPAASPPSDWDRPELGATRASRGR